MTVYSCGDQKGLTTITTN